MEPFSPQDPVRKLLDQARELNVRPNFTQNVVRAARQTPQERGWLAGLRAWWSDNTVAGGLTVAAGAVAAVMLAFAWMPGQPADVQAVAAVLTPVEDISFVDEMPLLPTAEAAWQGTMETESLLAVEDTSLLTDSDISYLLY